MQKRLKPLILSWVIVAAAICSSPAQPQPAAESNAAAAKEAGTPARPATDGPATGKANSTAPSSQRNFSNMGVLERKAILDEIGTQDLPSIFQAWVDADRVEHDQDKHWSLRTVLTDALRWRASSPEVLAQMRAFIHDPANSVEERATLIAVLGDARRNETTDVLLDLWAHLPPKELKNGQLRYQLLLSLREGGAEPGLAEKKREAIRALLAGEQVRQVLWRLALRLFAGLLSGLIPFFIFWNRDKKWARNGLLLCVVSALVSGGWLALPAAIITAIVGLRRPTLPETLPGEDPRPFAKLAVVSLVAPVSGFGIGLIIIGLTPQYPNSFIPNGIGWLLGLWGIASIVGINLAIRSLKKRERWPLMAVVSLLMNGMPFLYLAWIPLRSLLFTLVLELLGHLPHGCSQLVSWLMQQMYQ